MKKWVPIKKRIITLRVTEDMYKNLEFKSYQMQKPTSEVLRLALEKFLSIGSDKDK